MTILKRLRNLWKLSENDFLIGMRETKFTSTEIPRYDTYPKPENLAKIIRMGEKKDPIEEILKND